MASYVFQRFEPPSRRTRCHQLRLSIEGDGFELSVMDFYSDWGDRSQEGTTYRGTASYEDGVWLCRATHKRVVDIFYDHDGLGDYVRNERATLPCDDELRFVAADGALVCPAEIRQFAGERLGTAKPVADLFADPWKPRFTGQ